jgi:GMP synthase (glutamine-hydrolysing)
MSQRDHDLVLVVDFGAQYAQLIARRVREAHVYSEIVPHTASAAEILARNPKAIILSGGPSSVYEPGAPRLDLAVVDGGTPVLGIATASWPWLKYSVVGCPHGMREYGRTVVSVTDSGTLLAGLPEILSAWMSHGDEVTAAPEDFRVTATSTRATVAAFENLDRRLAGVQWHPEVLHTERGQQVLENFLFNMRVVFRTGLRPTSSKRRCWRFSSKSAAST